MAKKHPSPAPAFALQGDLDVFSIHGQWESLRTHLEALGPARKTDGVELDLSGIGDVDLSGIQLLLALKCDLEAEGASLKLSGVKPDWAQRLHPLGLGGLLGGEHP